MAIGHDSLCQKFSLSTNQENFSPIATYPIDPRNYVFCSQPRIILLNRQHKVLEPRLSFSPAAVPSVGSRKPPMGRDQKLHGTLFWHCSADFLLLLNIEYLQSHCYRTWMWQRKENDLSSDFHWLCARSFLKYLKRTVKIEIPLEFKLATSGKGWLKKSKLIKMETTPDPEWSGNCSNYEKDSYDPTCR